MTIAVTLATAKDSRVLNIDTIRSAKKMQMFDFLHADAKGARRLDDRPAVAAKPRVLALSRAASPVRKIDVPATDITGDA